MPKCNGGSVTVIVLLVLTAVTIIGVMSINTSSVELLITRNERESREIFYQAEGGAMEGVQRLANTAPVDLAEKHLAWHHGAKDGDPVSINFRDPQAWDMDGSNEDNALQSAIDDSTYIAAVEQRLAPGSSAIVTESRLYLNRVFGLSTKHNAAHVVETGYYLRY